MQIIYILLAVLLATLVSCQQEGIMKIAISKGSGSASYVRYGEWLKEVESNIEVLDMYNIPLDSALELLEGSSGLVLSGGSDVHPGRYGKEYDTTRCEINLERDTLEFALIRRALELKMPIFAICRGEQILNVALGGSLIVDIPEDHPSDINHSCKDKFSLCHEVEIVENTLLANISGVKSDGVTSSHHQAVDKLAPGVKANCFSPDGIVEGFEWAEPVGKPFMMAVQWHPERMLKEPLSKAIAVEFFKNVRLFSKKSK